MTGDTIECFNCGHENPSWAQVCRSCGYGLQQAAPISGGPAGLFPTDQASLTAIGGAMAAIVGAIVLGLIFSGAIPPVPAETPSPTPTPSASAAASEIPSAAESAAASVIASPALAGTVVFGTGWDNNTHTIIGETSTFTSASPGFAYGIILAEPIGVDSLEFLVVRVEADGKETVVQTRKKGTVFVDKTLMSEGIKLDYTMAQLYGSWGKGTLILRVYRGEELMGQGTFVFS